MDQKPKIAIIGSGLSGLSAGYMLSPYFTVHLYEKSATLGMDSGSLEFNSQRVDVPMRSFFPEYYPNLRNLYNLVKIPFGKTDSSMSFAYTPFSKSPAHTYQQPISYPANMELSDTKKVEDKVEEDKVKPAIDSYFSFSCFKIGMGFISLPDVPSLVQSPLVFVYQLLLVLLVIMDYFKLLIVSKIAEKAGWLDFGRHGPLEGMTVGEFFEWWMFSSAFVRGTFFPLFSGVCTCSFEQLQGFPATFILEYVAKCMPFGEMCFVTSSIEVSSV